MLIKDLVVTGLVKLIRHATIRELLVEAINEVTKEEIDTLKGTKSNIQEQISTISSVVDTAKTEQTTWKSAIANAINRIKRNPNNEGLSNDSTLSAFVSHIGNIEHGPDVSGVTATAEDVLKGKKIVDSLGNIVTGTIVSIPSNMILKSAGTYILSSYYDGDQWVSCDEQTVLWLLLPINGHVYKNRPLCFPLSNFGGDTNAEHVIKGKTFTSKNGYKMTGTMPDRTGQSDMTNSPVYGYFEQGSSSYDDGYYGCRIPYGYYGQDFDDGTADIRIDANSFNFRIGLSSDKIRYDCTIGGVYGTFTHDMVNRFDDNSGFPCEPITSDDVVFAKCGYVNGRAVRGHIQEATSTPGTPYDYRSNRQIVITTSVNTVYRKPSDSIYAYSSPYTAGPMARPYVVCSYSDMADLIGLTANKIMEGNTILGVEGTASDWRLKLRNILNYVYSINDDEDEVLYNALIIFKSFGQGWELVLWEHPNCSSFSVEQTGQYASFYEKKIYPVTDNDLNNNFYSHIYIDGYMYTAYGVTKGRVHLNYDTSALKEGIYPIGLRVMVDSYNYYINSLVIVV